MERKRISQVEWKNNKMTEVNHKIKPKTTKPVLSDPDNKNYLEELYTKIVIVPVDKASNSLALICGKYYSSKLLVEVSPNKIKSLTSKYSQSLNSKEELFEVNIKYGKKFKAKTLPIMHW